jgi:dsDNA-specific endonuclease/ATPase MutS2
LPDNKNIRSLALAIENYLDANQYGYSVIRIEVWSSQYDTETLRPTYQKLNMIDYQSNRPKK